ncbi:MAG: GNAT family N-acetyltransferase [Candidatus Accumulibacter sp.]|jgi:phosphinothricin acetyltransferase|nr:GNAT family N-acetyltransferase [Accumulibacter sp.]
MTQPNEGKTSRPTVRDSLPGDVPQIARIYAHWVRFGLASFELEAPPEDEMARRRQAVIDNGFPHLVATTAPGGTVAGYAYASVYRPRAAYRFSCENSIYISPDHRRSGVGRALLAELIARCEKKGFRLMVAVIGDSGNLASIGLHRSLGFQHAGQLKTIGWKHDRWVDSVLMTRPLGEGSRTPPDEFPR